MAPSGAEPLQKIGASDEARTRYLHLGKVALYQMSYTRVLDPPQSFLCGGWCLRSESNQRHEDFQSSALPTELQRQMATRKGLEPSTSGVTGRRSNQLNYRAIFVSEYHKQIALYYAVAGAEGIEPSARGFGDRCSTC